ncbi:SusC/RagA family TonB-linked outer membrane protein [Flavitalea flava]
MKILYVKKLCLFSFFSLLFLGSSFSLKAQETPVQVTGTVRDDMGLLIPNVSVSAFNKRTKYAAGVQTDSTGVFRFSALPVEGDYVFNFSFIGFESQVLSGYTLKTGMTLTLAVKLRKKAATLNDVIVIGYGTTSRRNVVGSVNVVAPKEAGATTGTNPSQLLIGKAAGVQVVQGSGSPGSDAQIIIRGTGTFTSVDPLYVVDGIQTTKNYFNTISVQDIESITVLKDASSTAIYGAAAANGVVIITTRKGKPGPPRINITSQWGVARPWKRLDLMNAAQYVDALRDLAATKNTVLPAKFSNPGVLADSTDWQSEIFRPALQSEQDINISGGSEKVSFTASATYIDQKSIQTNFRNKRLQARLSLDETLGRFHFTQSLSYRQFDNTGITASILDAIQYPTYKGLLDPNIQGGYSVVTNIDDYSNANNPLQALSLGSSTSRSLAFFPQFSGEVRILNGLKFKSQFSAEINSTRANTFQSQYQSANLLNQARLSTLTFTESSFYTLENYLSFDRIFGKHQISLTAGNSYLNPGLTNQDGVRGSNQPNDNIQNISVAPTQSVTGSYSNFARPSGTSYFGRVNYTYNGKYILTGSYRRDGASNFGANHQFGNFAAAGAAWRFSDEDFMKKNLRFLSDGKLRAGWGQTGNNNIANFLNTAKTYQGTPAGSLVYSFGSTEAFVSGTTITTVSNPDLQWEQTNQMDIGLDLAFFNNKLTIAADYYDRKSTKLLTSIILPASVGVSTTGGQPSKPVNAADADNKGIELAIGYQGKINHELSYNIGINGAINKNKVLSLGAQFSAPIQSGAFSPVPATTYTATGSTIGSFYGYRLDHVAKDADEITALNQLAVQKTGNAAAIYQSGLLPGDFIFKDLNGDGLVTSKDQQILGNAIPKYVFGINAGLTYKGFDLNMVISGVSGLKILNGTKLNTQSMSTGHNGSTALLNRWKKPGDVAALPRVGQNATGNGNLRPSDWWLEDGSYLRMRNITIGYSLPARLLSGFAEGSFRTVRLYIAAQNLFTITGYTGYDPEVGGNYLFARGIDLGQVPQQRTFLAGLQLGF